MGRLELQTLFEGILGSKNVYFQAPATTLMKYPAIRYSLSKIKSKRADNRRYTKETAYQVILIDKNPESQHVQSLLNIDYCKFDRAYTADNLNHFSFTITI